MTDGQRVELAIVGGGVAGTAAAGMAAELGLEHVVLDEGATDDPAVVWGIWGTRLAYVRGGRATAIEAGAVIVATGSRDRTVVFPGGTLPGVVPLTDAMTAEEPPPGRVLVVGNGPHLIVAAAFLHARGARLIGVVEAAAVPRLTARDRIWLRRRGVPYFPGRTIVEAIGEERVKRSSVARLGTGGGIPPGSGLVDDVETIVVGFGRTPASELTRLAGARHSWSDDHGLVLERDAWLRTSAAGIIACGDCAVPGRVPGAVAEGRLAAITAALDLGRIDAAAAERLAAPIRRRIARARRVDELRAQTFRVGSALHRLARPDDVLCPCEDVTVTEVLAALDDEPGGLVDPNVLKVRTRAGMGFCQGRRCGEHLTWLVAERSDRSIGEVEPLSVRPPIVPIPIEAFGS
jgi:thioredoxin reductase